jgi:hypothetical protein
VISCEQQVSWAKDLPRPNARTSTLFLHYKSCWLKVRHGYITEQATSTMSKRKKTSSGVAPSSGDVDRHLNTFECHEISRLYKHLINVTKGDSSLVSAKYELAARSLSSLLKKLSPIRSLSIQAADDHTLHGTYLSTCHVSNDSYPISIFLFFLFPLQSFQWSPSPLSKS